MGCTGMVYQNSGGVDSVMSLNGLYKHNNIVSKISNKKIVKINDYSTLNEDKNRIFTTNNIATRRSRVKLAQSQVQSPARASY